MADPDLRQHLARVTACLAEAVDHVTANDPGGDHDAGLWAAAVAEAAAALAGQPGSQLHNTRAPRGTSAALLLAAPELARALAEIARLTSFCFNPTPRDVAAAKLAREALTAAGITDPAAWLAAQARS